MNPFLKLALEIGPLAAFFIGYRVFDKDMIAATVVFMVAMAVALIVSWLQTRSLPKMSLVTAVVVFVFGGLTIYLGDGDFIKMKPTIVNGLFALVLGFGLLQGRSYLKLLMEESLPLTDRGWMIMTRNWTLFFVVMAVLNEAIWRTQSEEFWVNVKTFGYLPLTLIFTVVQVMIMQRHLLDAEKK